MTAGEQDIPHLGKSPGIAGAVTLAAGIFFVGDPAEFRVHPGGRIGFVQGKFPENNGRTVAQTADQFPAIPERIFDKGGIAVIRLPAGDRRHDQQPETVAGFMERGILIVMAQTHKIIAALLDEHGIAPLSVFRHSVANERVLHVAVGAVEESPDAVQVEALFRKFNGADAEFFLHGVDRFAIVGHQESGSITDRRLRRPEGSVRNLRLEPERVIRIGADLHRVAFHFKDARAVRGGDLQFHRDLIRLFCQLEDLKAAGGRHLVDHMAAGRDLCGAVRVQLFRPQEHAAAGRNGNCQRIGDVDRFPHVEFCIPVKTAVIAEVHGRDGLTGRHIP